MNEPRPAMISARPPDRRSTSANCWNTRTGSSELSTDTALVNRMRAVRAAMAASTTAGDEDTKSARWCSPTPNTSRPAWSATTASSIASCSRCAGDTVAPVSGSGERSTNVYRPSSIAALSLVVGRPATSAAQTAMR
jgi:hypothetical protein